MPSSITYRTHRPGDMGYIIHRHGLIYAQEYQWDERFEAMVARIAADFIENYDAALEQCWIAEQDGRFMGCVCLVKDATRVNAARIRLLLVEPSARGLGLGKKLVQQCVDFARDKGFAEVVLLTHSILGAARTIYQKTGFKCVAEEECHFVPSNSMAERWEMRL